MSHLFFLRVLLLFSVVDEGLAIGQENQKSYLVLVNFLDKHLFLPEFLFSKRFLHFFSINRGKYLFKFLFLKYLRSILSFIPVFFKHFFRQFVQKLVLLLNFIENCRLGSFMDGYVAVGKQQPESK